jgi:hypothetical protein
VEDEDGPYYAELLRTLAAVDGWLARLDPVAVRPQPPPGSPMRADDQRLDPYQISHASWHSLSHGVDHLNCLRTLLRETGVIHMYAPYSLVRSALENASAAVWMLQPPSRADRLTRRLQFAAADIRNGEQARQLAKQAGPRTEAERLDQVRQIAQQAGIDPAAAVRRVGFAKIVEAAGGAPGLGADVIVLVWRLCSGITHGDFWTTPGAAQMAELPGAPPGMGTFKVTANIKILMYVTTIATLMTNLGWQLYDQRRRAPYPL